MSALGCRLLSFDALDGPNVRRVFVLMENPLKTTRAIDQTFEVAFMNILRLAASVDGEIKEELPPGSVNRGRPLWSPPGMHTPLSPRQEGQIKDQHLVQRSVSCPCCTEEMETAQEIIC